MGKWDNVWGIGGSGGTPAQVAFVLALLLIEIQ